MQKGKKQMSKKQNLTKHKREETEGETEGKTECDDARKKKEIFYLISARHQLICEGEGMGEHQMIC